MPCHCKMATNLGSCDFLFDNETYVESVPERFACPICFCPVQRDAHLTLCCGHHFCFQCIDVVRKDVKPCPMCKASSVHIFPNKERQRDIKLLKVRCAVGQESSDKKCEWSGELGKLAPHAKEQHRVTLDGWLMGTGESQCTSQYSPQPHNASRPTPRPPPTSQPSPHPSSQPPVTSQSSAAAQPGPRLVRIAQTQFQCSPQLHRPLPQPSPQAPPTSHSRPTGQLVLHPFSPSRASTNQSKCSGRAQFRTKQTHPSPQCMKQTRPFVPMASCLHPHPSCPTKPKCTTVTPPHIPPTCPPPTQANEYVHLPEGRILKVYQRKDGSKFYNDHGRRQDIQPHHTVKSAPITPPTCSIKKSPCQPAAQASEYVHLPEGRTLKVYQRKDGSKFYNDHGRRQDISPHHIVKPALYTPPPCPIKKVPCQPAAQASEYVHLPEGRVLKVYQRKDGSKFYNDHGRRQNVQPHHFVNPSPVKQTVTPTRCTPCKPAVSNTPTEYVHLAGGRKLKVYQRKDGSKYYNDHGRRKNL